MSQHSDDAPVYGFVMHPLSLQDVYDFEPGARDKPVDLVRKVLCWMPDPFEIASLEIRTDAGSTVRARIQCVPRLPEQMIEDTAEIRGMIIRAAQALESAGANIIGLGAYCSIAGEHGRLVQKAVNVPVTSGNSFTVLSAIEATTAAALQMDIKMSEAKAVVIGATGSIGTVVASLMASQVKELVLVGRRSVHLIGKHSFVRGNVTYSTDIKESISGADIVLSASSDPSAIVQVEDLRQGCVVCDIARPRDVAEEAAKKAGVMVIEGGIIRMPGEPLWTTPFSHFNNLGLPYGQSFACFAETALRSLEPALCHTSIGINVKEIGDLGAAAKKHGFEVSGIRNFDRPITADNITKSPMAKTEPVSVLLN